ncbi:MAG: hypothetical protein Q7S92_05540 [Candidatus Diapherotrites archaeon]|nr:hypothetical protein [Candidatus Diapherotrites archaeon]
MKLGIDFGASHTDLVLVKGTQIIFSKTIPVTHFRKPKISELLKEINLSNVNHIFVTGWGARYFPKKYQNILVSKTSEIQAIALGAQKLSKKKNCLVISMGSGTAIVSVKGKKFKHIGGTAVGGRMLLGLSELLLNTSDIQKVFKWSKKGRLDKVDLLLKEIYPQGLGHLPWNVSAAHFGYLQKPSKFDLSIALLNLVAQTIGSISLFAAKAYNHKTIVFVGRLAESKEIQTILKKRIHIFAPHLTFIFPKNAGLAVALGSIQN